MRCPWRPAQGGGGGHPHEVPPVRLLCAPGAPGASWLTPADRASQEQPVPWQRPPGSTDPMHVPPGMEGRRQRPGSDPWPQMAGPAPAPGRHPQPQP